MFLHRKVKLALVLACIFLLLFAVTMASARPDSQAVVTLSADQSFFAADQQVVIHVNISNPTRHTIHVLSWYTPVDGVEEPLFAVARDGTPVAYTGAVYKRPAPTGQDYIQLKAGESITSDVSLGTVYDLSASGTYSVVYDISAMNLTAEKGNPNQAVESLSSNTLVLGIEGRQALNLFGEAVAPDAVTGSTSFVKCNSSQQSLLVQARSQASVYSTDAKGYLQANKTGARYTTWFGVYNSSRYSTVTTHFNSITNAMDTASVTFNCGCKKKYYAYVYPNQPYVIYLCSVFWQAPMTGTDSKAGTLIHEMSHFYVVASTTDYVYGQAGAKNLAITDPAKAIMNADNHEYFAENTPSLP